MNSRRAFQIGGIFLLVIFAGFSMTKFSEALTPYVSYDEARATTRSVQVAGGLAPNSSSYDMNAKHLRFTLGDTEDSSKTLAVRYSGLKPANFEDAISIVAIGNFDSQTQEFVANDLLVKCPSKYQGVEGYEEKSYGSESAPKSYGPSYSEPAEQPSTTPAAG